MHPPKPEVLEKRKESSNECSSQVKNKGSRAYRETLNILPWGSL